MICERFHNWIRFGDRINDSAARAFISELEAAQEEGHHSLVLDFTATEQAWTQGMMPVIIAVERTRLEGGRFQVQLPLEAYVRRQFLNSNWAHFLDPQAHGLGPGDTDRHLALQRLDPGDSLATVQAIMGYVLRTTAISEDLSRGLEWSLFEVADNVGEHSGAREAGFVQLVHYRDGNHLSFTIADLGCGIGASMREAFPDLTDDSDAIARAVEAGVTRYVDQSRGNGLAGALLVAELTGGALKIMSGTGFFDSYVDAQTGKRVVRTGHVGRSRGLGGTVVDVDLGLASDIDLQAMLRSAAGVTFESVFEWDFVDASSVVGTDARARVRVLEEGGSDFGSRASGRRLFFFCRNLLERQDVAGVDLDWSDVRMASTSFVDEAVGGLLSLLGPDAFRTRVTLVHVDSAVEAVLRVVLDRRSA